MTGHVQVTDLEDSAVTPTAPTTVCPLTVLKSKGRSLLGCCYFLGLIDLLSVPTFPYANPFNIQISHGRTIWIWKEFSFPLQFCFTFMPVACCFAVNLHWKLIEILHTLCSNYLTPHLKHAKGKGNTLVQKCCCCCFPGLQQCCKRHCCHIEPCLWEPGQRQQVFLNEISMLPDCDGSFTL